MSEQEEKEHIETLSEIRSLMERSSRFISLSGLSGVIAGIFAIGGAIAAHIHLNLDLFNPSEDYFETAIDPETQVLNMDFVKFFLIDALGVLIASLAFGIFFTTRKAKKNNLKIWDNTAKRLMINLIIPLAAGGVFCLIMLQHRMVGLIAPATLLFYGLALLNASKYTLNDIRYLGISEIILGLIGCLFMEYGLLLWTIGFGLLHIIYGAVMYFKYEKDK